MSIQTVLIAAMVIVTEIACAQQLPFSLSATHTRKLNSIPSAEKRLKSYYKYFKKDSSRYNKQLKRKYRHAVDSTCKSEQKLKRKSRTLLNTMNDSLLDLKTDSIAEKLSQQYDKLNDAGLADSLRILAIDSIRLLDKLRFSNIEGLTSFKGQSLDSSDVIAEGRRLLDRIVPAEYAEFNQMLDSKQPSAPHNIGADSVYSLHAFSTFSLSDTASLENLASGDSLKNFAESAALGKALGLSQQNIIGNTQQKLSALLVKYQKILNSNDPATAIKRTSLEGKSFKERLSVSANFNTLSVDPLMIAASPMVGYRINKNVVAGIGFNYRFILTDSVSPHTRSTDLSYKAFSSCTVYKSVFLTAEYDVVRDRKVDESTLVKTWKHDYYVGLGRRFLIHPKLYFTATALYHLNHEGSDPSVDKISFRFGVQLSELALRQKKLNYHPNR
jgi:hypothetical protein